MTMFTTAATLAAGLLATGTAVVGVHATTAEQAGPATRTLPCGAVWDRLPTKLQGDLAALADQSPAERRTSLEQIRRDARAGEYGDRVERLADRRQHDRSAVWSRLPAELKEDVREAKGLPVDERAAAYAGIRERAAAGAYGDRVQTNAQRLQERRATCAPTTGG